MAFEKLFEPITIRGLAIPNRIVMPAMALFYAEDYAFTERFHAFYRERARGGVGLMIVGPIAVDRLGSNPFMPGLFDDRNAVQLRGLVDAIHSESATRVGVQLMQQGPYAFSKYTGATALAPSPVRSKFTGEVPREMTLEDIHRVQDAFVAAARRSRAAGFDYVEIITAGYLIGSFLSPVTNHRSDAYGGPIENRMRFGLEVIRKVRAELGDFPLGIRVSGHDFVEGGHTNLEAGRFCVEAEKAGVDAICVTGGWHETRVPQITSDVPPGAYVHLARGIKQNVRVPVFASNRLGDPEVAERALTSGSADMVCWARPLLCDPELPRKVRNGRVAESVPCIACNQGCFDSIVAGKPVTCTVNPRVGREAETPLAPAARARTVFVAGGGPAGMECALVAALRGHRVTLFESTARVGGQVNFAAAVVGKESFLGAARSLEHRLRVAGVRIELKTPLTAAIVVERRPDVVVVASGATPATLRVPGVDAAKVVNAWDVLDGTADTSGARVVVVGGNATGCETALVLASAGVPDPQTVAFLLYHAAEDPERIRKLLYGTGRKVTVLEMTERMAANVGPSTRWRLLKDLKLMGVELRPSTRLAELTRDAVVVDAPSGREAIPADLVVMAVGARAVNGLAGELEGGLAEVVTIGDAKQPRKLIDAIREGFELGMKL